MIMMEKIQASYRLLIASLAGRKSPKAKLGRRRGTGEIGLSTFCIHKKESERGDV